MHARLDLNLTLEILLLINDCMARHVQCVRYIGGVGKAVTGSFPAAEASV